MSIEYTYEIIAVDAAAKVMEIVYSAPGHETMHIGARLPYVGETLEAVVDMYAPVPYWEAQQLEVVVPQVGTTGQISPVVQPVGEPVPTTDLSYNIEQIPEA